MDKLVKQFKAELKELGFHDHDKTMKGRIPQNGTIKGTFIEVELEFYNFPIYAPLIKLISINGKQNLYKNIPPHWRHLDEFRFDFKVDKSQFFICCLHNWEPKPEYNALFVYKRLCDWLKSNVVGHWKDGEDLLSPRIIPDNSKSLRVIVDKGLLINIPPNQPFRGKFNHHYYRNKNQKKIDKKNGNNVELNNIDLNSGHYYYIPQENHPAYLRLNHELLGENHAISEFLLCRLPYHFQFKTTYQLFQSIRTNYEKDIQIFIDQLRPKNIPLLVFFRGDKGVLETLAFLTNQSIIKANKVEDIEYINMSVETLSNWQSDIRLTVGILGLGSLGGRVAELLAKKGVSRLLISDSDIYKAENLSSHILPPYFLGYPKSVAIKKTLDFLSYKHSSIEITDNDLKVLKESDLVIVTVGDNASFDKLVFSDVLNTINSPVIWAWVSPYNILSHIVITSKYTGCLNCYYGMCSDHPDLVKLKNKMHEELERHGLEEYDLCGNPHTHSISERMEFLATQIVSVVDYYTKHKRFKFDYVQYYWGINDIIPTAKTGYLKKHPNCVCK